MVQLVAPADGNSLKMERLCMCLTPAVSRTGVRSTEGTNKRSLLVSA